ncbi:hypothetical protein VNO77_03875 [Canavalia gladiata]|uniref:Uncharacterized protein n=1 Tax=Canavalia gladiata TaxID=3824 RepID=A0AAN9R788_CANGL
MLMINQHLELCCELTRLHYSIEKQHLLDSGSNLMAAMVVIFERMLSVAKFQQILQGSEEITVVHHGMEGFYLPKLYLASCKRGSCGPRKQTLSGWEQHAGCRAKRWKHSVKAKSSMLPLKNRLQNMFHEMEFSQQLDQ